jgi:hypothetical protein
MPRLELRDSRSRRTDCSGWHIGTSTSAKVYRGVECVGQVKMMVDQVKSGPRRTWWLIRKSRIDGDTIKIMEGAHQIRYPWEFWWFGSQNHWQHFFWVCDKIVGWGWGADMNLRRHVEPSWSLCWCKAKFWRACGHHIYIILNWTITL